MKHSTKNFPVKLFTTVLGLAALMPTAQASTAPGNLPLYFESTSPARFVARGNDYQFLISPTGSQIILHKTATELASVKMEFPGANAQAQISGGEQTGKVNYLLGNDPAQWRAGVPAFAQVRVAEIFPGVNLTYHGNDRQLEYDFTIAAGANPDTLKLRFDGADKISINARGELVLSIGQNEILQPKPEIYQTFGGERKEISGGYKILDARTVAFSVGEFDHSLPLVIDPTLAYSTYFGGNSGDIAWSVAVDADGFVYIAGQTLSTKFANGVPLSTPGAFQTNFQGGKLTGDAFVAKFDNSGTNLIYMTYLGGNVDDGAFGIAVDADGDAYVTGFSDSPNFPVKNALYPKISGVVNKHVKYYPVDAFVTELDPGGSNLIYSTYLGGSEEDSGVDIAVDSSENAYVTGFTTSKNFPVANALYSSLAGTQNAFVTEIASNGAALIFSTYLGGEKTDEGEGIAVDSSDYIYVAGFTDSTKFPTTNAFQPRLDNGIKTTSSGIFAGSTAKFQNDAFATKFNPSGAGLVYSTFLGGKNEDEGLHIAVDGSQNAYVTGFSSSSDFPNTNTITHTNITGISQAMFNANMDAFLTKFDPSGALIYSARFGGKSNDIGYGVATDPSGDAFVVGATLSTDFPVYLPSGTNAPLRGTRAGKYDAFVTGFNADGSALIYSTYFGGKLSDYGYGIWVDSETNVYIVGQTTSVDFPATNSAASLPAFQSKRNGTNDAFVVKILPDP